jgi:hypothetical protein
MNWNHGTSGLLIGYGISAFAVLLGLTLGRAPAQRLLFFPFIATPVCLIAVMLWSAMAGPLQGSGLASNLIPYLGLIFIAIFSGLAGKILAKLPDKKNHKRGTILDDNQKITRKILKPKGLTLAGLPVAPNDETKHFKMIGTTGTGKSTAIRELLTGALYRGARAVIADTEGAESSWRNYARVFLTSLLHQLHRVKIQFLGLESRGLDVNAVNQVTTAMSCEPDQNAEIGCL